MPSYRIICNLINLSCDVLGVYPNKAKTKQENTKNMFRI